jgi:leader peptidase (prepilin peptidase) / N-methyltransferase
VITVDELPPSLVPLAAAWCVALGAVVGSFLNVVIARVPVGESIVHPGSRCPKCRAAIRWFDNVPVVSWLVLRARCRVCGVRISPRYPLVELAGGAAALVAFARHGLGGAALAEFALVATLLALALIDLDTWLLPNAITWPLIAAGVLANGLGAGPVGSVRPSLYGAGIGFAAFSAVAVVGEKILRREAMGFGDVWLLAALGAWLGHAALLPVVLLASLQGAIVGIGLLATGRGEPGPAPVPDASPPAEPVAAPLPALPQPVEEPLPPPEGPPPAAPAAAVEEEEWVPPRNAVPFGPFLAIAALEWLYLGDVIVRAVPSLGIFR